MNVVYIQALTHIKQVVTNSNKCDPLCLAGQKDYLKFNTKSDSTEFKASGGYTSRSSLKQNKAKQNKR